MTDYHQLKCQPLLTVTICHGLLHRITENLIDHFHIILQCQNEDFCIALGHFNALMSVILKCLNVDICQTRKRTENKNIPHLFNTASNRQLKFHDTVQFFAGKEFDICWQFLERKIEVRIFGYPAVRHRYPNNLFEILVVFYRGVVMASAVRFEEYIEFADKIGSDPRQTYIRLSCGFYKSLEML